MTMTIINLTQHVATQDQIAAGVVEPADKAAVQSLLTFAAAPCATEMLERARALALIARDSGAESAMIGGAPYFMPPLEAALVIRGVTPLYSFTERRAVDVVQDDGKVKKVQLFQHVGWVAGTAVSAEADGAPGCVLIPV